MISTRRALILCLSLLPCGLCPAEEERSPLLGYWVQQDSGGILHFLEEGRIEGWPLGGTWEQTGEGKLLIRSGTEELSLRWERVGEDVVELTREGVEENATTRLQRLRETSLRLQQWAGRYFIWHMVAGDKRATGRAVLLESTGHFRTSEGGFYLRVTPGPGEVIYGYASGEEDQTLRVRVLEGGRYLVIFDRLNEPRLFASCMRVEGAR